MLVVLKRRCVSCLVACWVVLLSMHCGLVIFHCASQRLATVCPGHGFGCWWWWLMEVVRQWCGGKVLLAFPSAFNPPAMADQIRLTRLPGFLQTPTMLNSQYMWAHAASPPPPACSDLSKSGLILPTSQVII